MPLTSTRVFSASVSDLHSFFDFYKSAENASEAYPKYLFAEELRKRNQYPFLMRYYYFSAFEIGKNSKIAAEKRSAYLAACAISEFYCKGNHLPKNFLFSQHYRYEAACLDSNTGEIFIEEVSKKKFNKLDQKIIYLQASLILLSSADKNLDQLKQAERFLQKALKSPMPETEEYVTHLQNSLYKNFGELYELEGNYQKAAESYKSIKFLSEKDLIYAYKSAHLYAYQLNQKQKAVEILKASLPDINLLRDASDKLDFSVYVRIWETLWQQKEKKAALETKAQPLYKKPFNKKTVNPFTETYINTIIGDEVMFKESIHNNYNYFPVEKDNEENNKDASNFEKLYKPDNLELQRAYVRDAKIIKLKNKLEKNQMPSPFYKELLKILKKARVATDVSEEYFVIRLKQVEKLGKLMNSPPSKSFSELLEIFPDKHSDKGSFLSNSFNISEDDDDPRFSLVPKIDNYLNQPLVGTDFLYDDGALYKACQKLVQTAKRPLFSFIFSSDGPLIDDLKNLLKEADRYKYSHKKEGIQYYDQSSNIIKLQFEINERLKSQLPLSSENFILRNDIEVKNETIDKLKDNVKKAQKIVGKLQAKKTDLQQNIETITQKNISIEKEALNFKNQNKELNEKLLEAQTQLKNNQEQLKVSENKLKTLQEECIKLRQEKEKLLSRTNISDNRNSFYNQRPHKGYGLTYDVASGFRAR